MQKPATTFATIRTPSSYPASQKRCIYGSRADLCVPYRELSLSPTHHSNRLEENPPVPIYDTSGPYTDPEAEIDLARGRPAFRSTWTQEPEATERLGDFSSKHARRRQTDLLTLDLRFPAPVKPRRAYNVKNVSQMHSARKALLTPAM